MLICERPEGLQSAVTKLEKYCERWRLTVNLQKTKVLVFSKSGRIVPTEIKLNGVALECVRQYEYLGIVFCVSGSTKPAIERQYQKGLKAWYSLTSSVPNCMVHNVSYMMRLFDALVVPVVVVVVWGTSRSAHM